jgi:hypothetical protein
MYYIWHWKNGMWQPTGWWTLTAACTSVLQMNLMDWFFIFDQNIQVVGGGITTGLQAAAQLCPFVQ